MRIMKNTDKDYPCTNCGSSNTNIVKEGENPRLKCSNCDFMFSASDSKSAQEAGAIPDGPPPLKDKNPSSNPREPVKSEPQEEEVIRDGRGDAVGTGKIQHSSQLFTKIPRTIDYVFVSRDRKETEFISKKDLKKVALRWESRGKNYELFELQPKKSNVKIDIE